MVRAGGQKIVAATFRHDTSRNLDPQLHTHAVLANMVKGADGKWRSMANEGLYERQKLIGMLYRNELAAGLTRLGYDIEKTHADGRFEIGGVSRETVEAFSTRRAEIEAAMAERNLGASADHPGLAEARGADDARGEARHRPRRAPGRVGETGCRSRARCPGARRPRRRRGLPSPGHDTREREGIREDDGLRPHRRWPLRRGRRPASMVRLWIGMRKLLRALDDGAVGRSRTRGQARRRGRRLGDGASVRTRGGVRPRRPPRRNARACARSAHHRRGGTRGRGRSRRRARCMR